jgi:hypothetical protein
LLEKSLEHLKWLIWIGDRRSDSGLSRGDMRLGRSVIGIRNGGEANGQNQSYRKCAKQIEGHSRLPAFRIPTTNSLQLTLRRWSFRYLSS